MIVSFYFAFHSSEEAACPAYLLHFDLLVVLLLRIDVEVVETPDVNSRLVRASQREQARRPTESQVIDAAVGVSAGQFAEQLAISG